MTIKRHDPHPLQSDLLAHLQALRPELSYTHIGVTFRRFALAASPALLSALFNGDTGITGREVFALAERYGLDAMAEAWARLAGRTLAPAAAGNVADLPSEALDLAAAVGSLSERVRAAIADRRIDDAEEAAILDQLATVEREAAEVRAALTSKTRRGARQAVAK